ncbi:MAG: hypothetical protein ACYDGX_03970 [Thermoleophilia bacterium]
MDSSSTAYQQPELRKLGNIVDITFFSALWNCSSSRDNDDHDCDSGPGDD